MINNSSSSCRHCMVLIRIIVLESMIQNVRVFAKYVKSKDNGKADALSRLNFDKFFELGPDMNELPESIPDQIWPLDKMWLH